MFKEKGLVNELVEYIKSNLKKGYTKDSLRWALVNQGYSRLEVDKAIRKVDIDLANEAPILKTKPVIEHRIIAPENLKVKKWWEFWK
jgi:hypothetical protein